MVACKFSNTCSSTGPERHVDSNMISLLFSLFNSIQSLSDVESLVVVQNTLWVMANLTSALPNPSSERMRPLLVPIVDWLRRAGDIRGPAKLDVITYGVKAIKNMLYGGNAMIVNEVVQAKAIEPLLYILRRKIRDKEMSLLILNCIGNITSGEALLASDFLEHAIWILKNSNSVSPLDQCVHLSLFR